MGGVCMGSGVGMGSSGGLGIVQWAWGHSVGMGSHLEMAWWAWGHISKFDNLTLDSLDLSPQRHIELTGDRFDSPPRRPWCNPAHPPNGPVPAASAGPAAGPPIAPHLVPNRRAGPETAPTIHPRPTPPPGRSAPSSPAPSVAARRVAHAHRAEAWPAPPGQNFRGWGKCGVTSRNSTIDARFVGPVAATAHRELTGDRFDSPPRRPWCNPAHPPNGPVPAASAGPAAGPPIAPHLVPNRRAGPETAPTIHPWPTPPPGRSAPSSPAPSVAARRVAHAHRAEAWPAPPGQNFRGWGKCGVTSRNSTIDARFVGPVAATAHRELTGDRFDSPPRRPWCNPAHPPNGPVPAASAGPAAGPPIAPHL